MFREQNRGAATAQTYLLLYSLTLWRGGPGTSTTDSAPVPALYPLLASPTSVSGGVFTALWDANSTAVCWACQEGSPIYCISVLTLGMPVWSRSFSTSESLGFTPAFQAAGKACVSFGLRVRRIVEANWQASAPWAHRYPRRFPGVQRDKFRRKTRPGSRRRSRYVHGRERPRTSAVR